MPDNPFAEVYGRMYKTSDHEKYANLRDDPLLLDIELTNHCNMSCLFCGNRAQTRKKGFMTDEVFSRVLEQTGGRIPLRFVRWGENMLHRKMLDYFRMAKDRGVLLHLTTNGTLLDERKCVQFIELPLDSIKISFQGADAEGYGRMRNSTVFASVMENLKRLHRLRVGKSRPYIHISSSMTDESEEQISEFRAKVAPFCDSMDIGKTALNRYDIFNMNFSPEEFNRFVELRKKESLTKQYMECPEVFDKLSINWDGTVSACCGDYDNAFIVGDIRTQTITQIWRGEQMEEIRRMLLRGDHRKLSLCSTCFSPYSFVKIKQRSEPGAM